jgi:glutamate formiminotransferase
MQKIIECIPNFSEGRDKKKIDKICRAITNIKGILLLDVESDIAHNRSVITFAGNPAEVLEAAFQATKTAAQIIDLNRHKGEHPRIGATDVIPLVPIAGITMKECVRLAQKLGSRIGTELKIPVYLYEKASKREDRKNLANIRKGEYEGLKKEIGKNKDKYPDFGPKHLGKAGATVVGAREPLIAYNVNLDTKNIKIAKAIAKKIREKDGGFKSVKALGFELKDRGITQVSMNLTNYKITPPHIVFNAIKKEAKAKNVKIIESEIIGLIPQKALIKGAKHHLKIKKFKNSQVLENILKKKLQNFQKSL